MKDDFFSSGEVVKSVFKGIEQSHGRGKLIGLPTGFQALDELTGGLYPYSLTIIAGRPAIETLFCMNVAMNVALKENLPVAIFSEKTSKEFLVLRMICSKAGLTPWKFIEGSMHKSDWAKLTGAASHFSKAPIYIDDSLNSASEIRKKAIRLNRRIKEGLKLIIIDYLQLMKQPHDPQEIRDILTTLDDLSKILEIPVVVTSQVRRPSENEQDKRPGMEDLSDPAAIERYAEEIFFLYRDEIYNQAEEDPHKGIAEVIVAKHRKGVTGTVELKFQQRVSKI